MWDAITDYLNRTDTQFQVVTNFNRVIIGVQPGDVYNLRCRHDVTTTHRLSELKEFKARTPKLFMQRKLKDPSAQKVQVNCKIGQS